MASSPPDETREEGLPPLLIAAGTVIPIFFLIGFDLVRHWVEGESLSRVLRFEHLIFLGSSLLAVVIFSALMFRFILGTQRQVALQNRQLRAMNAVSQASHDLTGLDAIVAVTLREIKSLRGADAASLTVYHGDGDITTTLPEGADLAATPEDRLVTRQLRTRGHTVGSLSLAVPEKRRAGERVASAEALDSIAHHAADAIRLTQLIEDLQYRHDEGHAFYDILLQISNQMQPSVVLASIAEHARLLLHGEGAVVRLAPEAHAPSLDDPMRDLTVCPPVVTAGVIPGPDDGATDRLRTSVLINGPDIALGELELFRRGGQALSGRDHGVLLTLAEFAGIAIQSAHSRELGRQRAVLSERARIAREMHDSLAQVLGLTRLRLLALDARPELAAYPAVRAELVGLAAICHEAYQDVREAILGLSDQGPGHLDFEASLRHYLAAYSRQSGIETTLEKEGPDPLVLSPRCEVHLIRIVQEALTNVRKHSGAHQAVVRMIKGEDGPMLVVEDDGHGFDPDAALDTDEHFGLGSMRSRIGLLGGRLEIDSAPGKGTRVRATVPEQQMITMPVLMSDKEIADVNVGPLRADPDPAR